MSFNNMSEIMHWLYRAQVPVLLEGVHGIGKTSSLYQLHDRIRREKGQYSFGEDISSIEARSYHRSYNNHPGEFGIWSCSAQNLTTEELIGYPVVNGDSIKYLRTHNFIPPPNHQGGGIWVVDELNLATSDVRNALMSIFLEGRYLDYSLPDGIFIVGSQNPPTGEYHGSVLSPPLMDRFCILRATINESEVIDYFIKKKFSTSIIDAITENSELILNPHQSKAEYSEGKVPTSRSYEYVDRLIKSANEDDIKKYGLTVLSGLVGTTAAGILMKYVSGQYELSIDIEKVVTEYGWSVDYSPSTTMAEWPVTDVRRKVIKISKSAGVRIDIINVSLNRVRDRLKSISAVNKKDSIKTFEDMPIERQMTLVNIMVFLCDMPPDQGGGLFINKLSSDYEPTFKLMARHKIFSEYFNSWHSISKAIDMEKSND